MIRYGVCIWKNFLRQWKSAQLIIITFIIMFITFPTLTKKNQQKQLETNEKQITIFTATKFFGMDLDKDAHVLSKCSESIQVNSCCILLRYIGYVLEMVSTYQ